MPANGDAVVRNEAPPDCLCCNSLQVECFARFYLAVTEYCCLNEQLRYEFRRPLVGLWAFKDHAHIVQAGDEAGAVDLLRTGELVGEESEPDCRHHAAEERDELRREEQAEIPVAP